MSTSSRLIVVMRCVALTAVIIGSAHCAAASPPGPPPAMAPAAPNESVVTAQVLDAVIVESSTLDMLPQQPLSTLTLKLLLVKPVEGAGNFLHGKTGETIRAYSKDLSLVGLKGTTVTATVSFRGDERGGSFWVGGVASTAPGGIP